MLKTNDLCLSITILERALPDLLSACVLRKQRNLSADDFLLSNISDECSQSVKGYAHIRLGTAALRVCLVNECPPRAWRSVVVSRPFTYF